MVVADQKSKKSPGSAKKMAQESVASAQKKKQSPVAPVSGKVKGKKRRLSETDDVGDTPRVTKQMKEMSPVKSPQQKTNAKTDTPSGAGGKGTGKKRKFSETNEATATPNSAKQTKEMTPTKTPKQTPGSGKKTPKGTPGSDQAGVTLFVGNLPDDCSAEQLKKLSADIVDARVRKARWSKSNQGVFGFIEFANGAVTKKNHQKLQNATLGGKTLKVDFAGTAKKEVAVSSEQNQTVLHVAGVPETVRESDLSNAFPEAVHIDIPKSKKEKKHVGCAFVHFETEAAAKTALESSKTLKVKEKMLQVSFAKSQFARKIHKQLGKNQEKNTAKAENQKSVGKEVKVKGKKTDQKKEEVEEEEEDDDDEDDDMEDFEDDDDEEDDEDDDDDDDEDDDEEDDDEEDDDDEDDEDD